MDNRVLLKKEWDEEVKKIENFFNFSNVLDLLSCNSIFISLNVAISWIREEKVSGDEWSIDCYKDRLSWLKDIIERATKEIK